MKRMAVLTAMVMVLAGLLAGTAVAAVPSDVFPEVVDQGYYIEPGVPGIDEGALSDVVASARNAGIRYVVVILDEDPAGGATTFADAVLDRLGAATVLVLSDGQAGYASSEFTEAEGDAALRVALDSGEDDVAIAATFGTTLVQIRDGDAVPATTVATGGSGGGGSTGLIIFLIIVGGLVALVGWAIYRQNQRSKERSAEQLAAARAELQAQLDAMANDILALSDRADLATSPTARDQYEAASTTFTAASGRFETAQTWAELEELAVELDRATWQLDAAEATLDGTPVPAKPQQRESLRCFFDPTHQGPFEDAEIQTGTGTRRVRVCKDDADTLRRGQSPEPRYVQVGQEQVPAATAPRSRGGGGFGALDAFSILVGGMAASMPQRWDRPPQRSSRSASSRSTRSTSSQSATSSSSPTRSRGGASRRRRSRRRGQ